MTKKIELEFAPGCFDNFEGTQEELDELIADLQQLANSGELFDELGITADDLDNIRVGGVFDGELPDEIAKMIFGDDVDSDYVDVDMTRPNRTLH